MKKNVYEHPLTERVAEIHADRLCAGSPSIAADRDTPPRVREDKACPKDLKEE